MAQQPESLKTEPWTDVEVMASHGQVVPFKVLFVGWFQNLPTAWLVDPKYTWWFSFLKIFG